MIPPFSYACLCAPPSANRPDRRNANWANQHLGPCHWHGNICKGALHNNTVETELNLAAEKAENKEGDRHGRRGFGGSAGFLLLLLWRTKEGERYWKSFVLSIIMSGPWRSLHHTVASHGRIEHRRTIAITPDDHNVCWMVVDGAFIAVQLPHSGLSSNCYPTDLPTIN